VLGYVPVEMANNARSVLVIVTDNIQNVITIALENIHQFKNVTYNIVQLVSSCCANIY
jgi:hypothetical protein